MKSLIPLTVAILALLASSDGFSQQETKPQDSQNTLTKFDLDFPGGTPGELVAAIQNSMGRPLNTVIPERSAGRRLPPLKMKRVDVSQLFEAMMSASSGMVQYNTGFGLSHAQMQVGFSTTGNSPRTDNSVWFFDDRTPPSELEFCRFYLLTPYLEAGFAVDDITTAIETAWKMTGEAKLPKVSYHAETKLLIAVGYSRLLGLIDEALKALNVPQKPVLQARLVPAGQSETKK